MQRRVFIKRGLAGGALLFLGSSAWLALRGGKRLTPQRALLVLDAASYSVLVAVAGRVVAAPGADAAQIALAVDTALSYAPPEAQADLPRVLMLLENALAGALVRGKTAPFTTLSPPEQDAALLAWRDSSVTLLTGAYHALRRLCIGAFYAQMGPAKSTGYPGPPFEKRPAPAITARGPLSPPYVPNARALPALPTAQPPPMPIQNGSGAEGSTP